MERVTVRRGVLRREVESEFGVEPVRAVLYGPPGVGKTLLARTLAARVAHLRPDVGARWISATASARDIPFGNFSHVVEVGAADEPTALLRAAREVLTPPSAARLLLVVDDAHHLDALSATLVHHLAVATDTEMLLTVREGETVPDAIVELWKDDVLTRHDITPFDMTETVTFLQVTLGGPVEDVSADKIFDTAKGNPLYLRHLVEAALVAGTLRQVEGVWQLRGELSLPPRLTALVERHLAAQPAAVREVLDHLAVEEPLAVTDLAELTSLDAVELAESAGVLVVADHAGELIAHASHPLYTECIRAALGRVPARRLRGRLVARLAARSGTNLSDRLRIAGLALDTDDPPPAAELIGLAWEAMRLGDLILGERLARGALRQTGALSARLPLAHSLSWQGRGAEADATLSDIDPETLSDWDLMAWTLPKAANMFWMLSESSAAMAFLSDVRERIREPAARHTIDALAATFAMNSGEPDRSVRVAAAVLGADGAQDLAVAWASAAATLSSARLGRLGDVEPLARRGLAATHPGLLRFTIGLGQSSALVMAGQVGAAVELARDYLGFSEFQQPGRAIGEVLLGHTVLAAGAGDEAVSLLRQAAAALTTTGYSWGPLALSGLAQALGQQGHAEAATDALRRAEAAHGLRSEVYAPELAVARAWTAAANHDTRGARAAIRDAVAVARRSGQEAVAVRALLDGARLGDTTGLTVARHLARHLRCTAADTCADYLRALADGDGVALQVVSAGLEHAGMVAAAADAAAQSALAFRRRGDNRGETAARTLAGRLAESCGRPVTPALRELLMPSPLTDREREVAQMVSQGLTNRAIADRLGVSVRTVEGHVYRACTKLGAPDRSALGVVAAAAPREVVS